MHDSIDVAGQRRAVLDRAGRDPETACGGGVGRRLDGRAARQRHHVVACNGEPAGDMAAGEPARSGDEDAHRPLKLIAVPTLSRGMP